MGKTLKGLSLVEILVAVFLVAIIFLMLANWWQGYQKKYQKIDKYYQAREQLINMREQGLGAEELVTKNIYHKRITANNISLDYLLYKN